MLHKLQITLLIVLIPTLILFAYAEKQGVTVREIFSPNVNLLHIDGIPISVLIADTPEERKQGLSGKREIGAAGMLFIFDEPDYHGIWMKDMLFPIDIIWIDENLVVVGIDKSVRPDTYPKTFRPTAPVKYVVETEDRYTDTYGLGAGDTVRLPLSVTGDGK
jgi:uncharacterized membrane protein (UPF0127 family)